MSGQFSRRRLLQGIAIGIGGIAGCQGRGQQASRQSIESVEIRRIETVETQQTRFIGFSSNERRVAIVKGATVSENGCSEILTAEVESPYNGQRSEVKNYTSMKKRDENIQRVVVGTESAQDSRGCSEVLENIPYELRITFSTQVQTSETFVVVHQNENKKYTIQAGDS